MVGSRTFENWKKGEFVFFRYYFEYNARAIQKGKLTLYLYWTRGYRHRLVTLEILCEQDITAPKEISILGQIKTAPSGEIGVVET
jgi:hypothetical protein